MTGMTLKQFAAARFYAALDNYRKALESKIASDILVASVAVYCARRNDADRTAINRIFKEVL